VIGWFGSYVLGYGHLGLLFFGLCVLLDCVLWVFRFFFVRLVSVIVNG